MGKFGVRNALLSSTGQISSPSAPVFMTTKLRSSPWVAGSDPFKSRNESRLWGRKETGRFWRARPRRQTYAVSRAGHPVNHSSRGVSWKYFPGEAPKAARKTAMKALGPE